MIAEEINDQPMVVLSTPIPSNAKREPVSGMTNEAPVAEPTAPRETVLVIETISMAKTPLTDE